MVCLLLDRILDGFDDLRFWGPNLCPDSIVQWLFRHADRRSRGGWSK
jgi:hypothetical protein